MTEDNASLELLTNTEVKRFIRVLGGAGEPEELGSVGGGETEDEGDGDEKDTFEGSWR